MAAAEASDRAKPTTWCPAWRSSGTTAEPMWPVAPVTRTCICVSLEWMTRLVRV